MSFPVKSTDAASAAEELDYANDSFPVNPYYASANRAFLVATDEEEGGGGHDMDVPSNSRTISSSSSSNMIHIPIAIPISAGYYSSTSSPLSSSSAIVAAQNNKTIVIPQKAQVMSVWPPQKQQGGGSKPSNHNKTTYDVVPPGRTILYATSPAANNHVDQQPQKLQQQPQVYTSDKAKAALTWAIVGLLLSPASMGILLGPRAICYAMAAKREIQSSQQQQPQSSQSQHAPKRLQGICMANWAIIMSLVAILVSIGILLMILLPLIFHQGTPLFERISNSIIGSGRSSSNVEDTSADGNNHNGRYRNSYDDGNINHYTRGNNNYIPSPCPTNGSHGW
jgi:hypothetical protein